jgi:putative PIN family toxin of toxin-antitoxin system
MKPLRLVFDTNVYLAALKPGSYAWQWLNASGTDPRFNLYASPAVLAEVRLKLREKFKLPDAEIDRFMASLEWLVNVVYPTRSITAVPTDPDDNKILECAIAAKADLVISSDPHLYKLKVFEGIQIFHTSDLKYIFPQQPPKAA